MILKPVNNISSRLKAAEPLVDQRAPWDKALGSLGKRRMNTASYEIRNKNFKVWLALDALDVFASDRPVCPENSLGVWFGALQFHESGSQEHSVHRWNKQFCKCYRCFFLSFFFLLWSQGIKRCKKTIIADIIQQLFSPKKHFFSPRPARSGTQSFQVLLQYV